MRIFVAVLNISLLLGSDLSVSSIFGDNMVLQRDMPIKVWGWGETGTQVRVELADIKGQTLVDSDGAWNLELSAKPVGGPFDMLVIADDTLKYSNILMGEVWICSGQSNMGMTVGGSSRINNYKQEIENAHYPNIRHFTVKRAMASNPLNNVVSAGWFPVTPESIENFSATAYFFARDLQKGLEGIPIGLVHTSWGGTKIEAWTSAEALSRAGLFEDAIANVKLSNSEADESYLKAYRQSNAAWINLVDSLAGDLTRNLAFSVAEESWPVMDIPGYWEHTPGFEKFDGIMWFQRLINIPAGWKGQELFLSLGTVDDYDWTYVNGHEVGNNMSTSRASEYAIDPTYFSTGENNLTVRVLDVNRRGGLWGREQDLYLTPVNGGDTLWLAGKWSYKPLMNWEDHEILPPERPYLHNRPTVLYNAMLAPLTNLSMRGVIWYQGESNASRAHEYRSTFPLMIKDWRRAWNQGDFPFLYAQLPNWGERKSIPGEANWAELRHAQLQALELPNTSMAVTIDIGDARDIHPKNKQDVGYRLALLALRDVYGLDVQAEGPKYKSHSFKWGRAVVVFDETGGGLSSKDGGDIAGFSLAEEDGKFYWADAKIKGSKVIVTSKHVKRPVALRYAWGANPHCNLTNESGLPASPFKTDDWPDTTE
ncbi:MAG: 9-O-acetylesterase [Candidatus Marinimicrobia bacterium]|nr:9-O-acetylesterase [Candidatus Neomarinimicrobiota bacterium]